MRAASRLGITLAVLAFGCAGGNKAALPGATLDDDAGTPPALDVGARDAGGDATAPVAPAEEPEAPPTVDPAVSHALLAKTGEANGATPLGLRFEIVELGAELPWAFAVVNRGTEAAQVDFDARLLTLEVTPPPDPKMSASRYSQAEKPRKTIICRLPADVVPNSVDPALAQKLEPGEGLVENFDPRLYCLGKTALVEGAVVSPRFGWPPKMKVSWKGGKREEAPGKQSEPFVAEPVEAKGSLPQNGGDQTERRIKELTGSPLTLGSDFKQSNADEPTPDPSGLVFTLTGGDATDEGAVLATATLANHGKQKQELYFRRELITYEVSGPDGVFHCDPEPDLRSPDRSAFQTLRPGAKFSAVSRLIEMCPAHSFARPGLYLVHARFDANDAGTEFGLHAFTGRLLSQKPAIVRVREGELPFTPSNSAERVRVGQ